MRDCCWSRPSSTYITVIYDPLLQEACCAYVLMVTAVYWVSEAVPLGAAALVPAFLYPLFGVLKSSEVRSAIILMFELDMDP